MADKFIPFNPETAKNGDLVYGVLSKAEFIYIGPTPIRGHDEFVIVYDVVNEIYKAMPSDNLRIKAPKKTVWVNLVKYGLCGIESSVFACEKIAKGTASQYAGDYLGTFPIEIDDVA